MPQYYSKEGVKVSEDEYNEWKGIKKPTPPKEEPKVEKSKEEPKVEAKAPAKKKKK